MKPWDPRVLRGCKEIFHRDNRRAKRETGARDVAGVHRDIQCSEIPGCEAIMRSEYRETGRSGKAPSEARDRGTRYRHEAFCETQLFHEALRSIVITAERSERPGCEAIERSEYQETGRSRKAPSEARDRGTRYRHKALHACSSKVQYYSPAISKHLKIITSQFQNLKV